VAGDIMYKTEDGKSGHECDKKWSGQRKMEIICKAKTINACLITTFI
jgi:hypothetical protein